MTKTNISGSATNGRTLARFCDINDSPQIVVNPLPSTHVIFYSDSSISDKGFNFTYSTSPCGGILNGPSQTVSSPTRSGSGYPPNLNCAWLLDFDQGQQIEVRFFMRVIKHLQVTSQFENKAQFLLPDANWIGSSPPTLFTTYVCWQLQ